MQAHMHVHTSYEYCFTASTGKLLEAGPVSIYYDYDYKHEQVSVSCSTGMGRDKCPRLHSRAGAAERQAAPVVMVDVLLL